MVVTVEVVAAEEGAVNKRTGEEAGKIFSSLALHKGNNDLLKPRKKKKLNKIHVSCSDLNVLSAHQHTQPHDTFVKAGKASQEQSSKQQTPALTLSLCCNQGERPVPGPTNTNGVPRNQESGNELLSAG